MFSVHSIAWSLRVMCPCDHCNRIAYLEILGRCRAVPLFLNLSLYSPWILSYNSKATLLSYQMKTHLQRLVLKQNFPSPLPLPSPPKKYYTVVSNDAN